MSSTFRTHRSPRAGLWPERKRIRPHHPDFDKMATQGWQSLEAEGKLPSAGWRKERQWALDMGLPGADSLTDRDIPTFARGELPHFAGINTFMKAPYVENVRDVAKYDAAVIGIPFDSGTTYRPGTRFGPQGIRRISALYTPYNYELGVDLREQMTLCDAGDVFTIPANLEKSFDQISRASPMSSPRALCRSCLAAIIRSASPACVVSRNVPTRGSASSISIGTSTFRRRISMNACTPRPGTGRPTCRTSSRPTWCSSESAAGRCRAKASRSRASATPMC
jgi:hypothetical protein